MTQTKLKKILEQHAIWLETGGKKGVRVDLRRADLRWVDLRRADMQGANLRDAKLRRADMRWADMRWADLRDAKLQGADTQSTNIYTFQLTRHFGYYHEGYVRIGCEGRSLSYWLKHYKKIAKKHGYSDSKTKVYGIMFKALKGMFGAKLGNQYKHVDEE